MLIGRAEVDSSAIALDQRARNQAPAIHRMSRAPAGAVAH